MRLGSRVLSPELLKYARAKGIGTGAAEFRLGQRVTGIKPAVMPGLVVKTGDKDKTPPTGRLSVTKIEAEMKTADRARLLELTDAELDITENPARLGALRALLAKASKTGKCKDLVIRLTTAVKDLTPVPATA